MSTSNNHIIKKQVLEINMPKHLEETDIREKTKQYLANRLYPELEKLFDELGSDDEIIRIDNITIDTGTYPKEFITEEIIPKAISAIKKQLIEKIQIARKSPSTGSLEIIHTKQNPEQIISYFLHTGTLPWWYKNDKKSVQELFDLLVEKNPKFIINIVHKNTKKQTVPLRIISQFSEKSLAHLIHKAGVDAYIDIVSLLPSEKKIKYAEKLKKVANQISVESEKQKLPDLTQNVVSHKKKSDIQYIIDRFLKKGLVDIDESTDATESDIEAIIYKLVDKKLFAQTQLKKSPQKILLQLLKNGYTTIEVDTGEIFSKIFGKSRATKMLQKYNNHKLQTQELKKYFQEFEKELKEDNTRVDKVLTKILGKKLYTELNTTELTLKQKTEVLKNYFLKMEVPVLVQVETQATRNISDNLKYLYTIAYKALGKQVADITFSKNKSKSILIKKIQQLIENSTQKDIYVKNKNDDAINIQANSQKTSLHREYEKLQLLEYYLLTGVLPSMSSSPQHKLIEKLFVDSIKKEDETTKRYVWNLISDTTSLKRIVYTFSPQVLDRLLGLIEPTNINFIKNSIKEFSEILRIKLDSSISRFAITSVLYLIAIEFLIKTKGNRFDKEKFLKYILEQTAIKFGKEPKNWHKIIVEYVLNETKVKYSSELKIFLRSVKIQIEPIRNTTNQSNENFETEEQDKEGYFIENAGLVILHPYLSTMFRNLKLVEKNQFVNEEARERAVLLLQYIVTKEEVVPEHQLVLNKIICGMDITNPVPLHIDITREEKTEAEELIKAAIEYWPAIKNTSVEGFRSSFLWRTGIIRKEDEKWVLRVERKTYDMLLDKLPWGLSMIKFPWRKDIIYTEW